MYVCVCGARACVRASQRPSMWAVTLLKLDLASFEVLQPEGDMRSSELIMAVIGSYCHVPPTYFCPSQACWPCVPCDAFSVCFGWSTLLYVVLLLLPVAGGLVLALVSGQGEHRSDFVFLLHLLLGVCCVCCLVPCMLDATHCPALHILSQDQ